MRGPKRLSPPRLPAGACRDSRPAAAGKAQAGPPRPPPGASAPAAAGREPYREATEIYEEGLTTDGSRVVFTWSYNLPKTAHISDSPGCTLLSQYETLLPSPEAFNGSRTALRSRPLTPTRPGPTRRLRPGWQRRGPAPLSPRSAALRRRTRPGTLTHKPEVRARRAKPLLPPVTAAREQSEQKKKGKQKLPGRKRTGGGPVPSPALRPTRARSQAATPGRARHGAAPASAAGAGAGDDADDADACLFSSFFFSSLNAKQINPPPSAESFPLVVRISLILCSWKLYYPQSQQITALRLLQNTAVAAWKNLARSAPAQQAPPRRSLMCISPG